MKNTERAKTDKWTKQNDKRVSNGVRKKLIIEKLREIERLVKE